MVARRTSFHFPREAIAQLDLIRSRTFLDGKADVIRVALRTYDELLDLDESGCTFKIVLLDEVWDYSPYKKCNFPAIAKLLESYRPDLSSTTPKNFFFSKDATKSLLSIKKRSFAKTNADAIRVALAAYEELILIDEAGARLVVRDTCENEVIFHPYRPFSREGLSIGSSNKPARALSPAS